MLVLSFQLRQSSGWDKRILILYKHWIVLFLISLRYDLPLFLLFLILNYNYRCLLYLLLLLDYFLFDQDIWQFLFFIPVFWSVMMSSSFSDRSSHLFRLSYIFNSSIILWIKFMAFSNILRFLAVIIIISIKAYNVISLDLVSVWVICCWCKLWTIMVHMHFLEEFLLFGWSFLYLFLLVFGYI